MIDNIYSWCARASSYIRFKKDREEVYEELLAHLVDKVNELESTGLSYQQAQMQAIKEMGDADNLGATLRKIHKPYLGWLWVFSKYLFIGSFLLFLLVQNKHGNVFEAISRYSPKYPSYSSNILKNDDNIFKDVNLLRVKEQHQSVYDYDFSLRNVGIVKDFRGISSMYFTIQANYPLWRNPPDAIRYYLRAIDSKGNEYDRLVDGTRPKSVVGNREKEGFTSSEFNMWIEEIDNTAKWIEVYYEMHGVELRFHIPLS